MKRLTEKQKHWVLAVIWNDEVSSDAELQEYFVENGLTEEQARHWVNERNNLLNEKLI